MGLVKRYCVEYIDGSYECFREDGFWYSDTGIIIKWAILGFLFLVFMLWFVGGYIHAKQRLRKGLPLLAYHRFLVPYHLRQKYPHTHSHPTQNHFTFYQQQQQQQQAYPGYGHPGYGNPYQQRQDGGWAEPPPMYNGSDAPPGYFAPPGATKITPHQGAMEMGQFGGPVQGEQYSGVVGGAGRPADPNPNPNGHGQAQGLELPPRPQQAKVVLRSFVDRFRR